MVRGSMFLAAVALFVGCGDDGGAAGSGPATASGTTTTTAGSSSSGSQGTGGSSGMSAGGSTGSLGCPQVAELCLLDVGLIASPQLEQRLGEPGLVVIDIRPASDYEAAHVPGATALDPADLRATVDGVPGQVAPPAMASAVFGAAGVGPDDTVVVVDQVNSTAAPRVVWTLAYYGHRGPLMTLDGGMDAWSLGAHPVEAGPAPGSAGQYPTDAIRDPLRVDQQWVLDRLDDPQVAVFDVRSPGEYDAGHIPGALNIEWTQNLGADGLYLGAPALAGLYGDLGADQTLVTYCQTGSRAAVTWLVLRLLGHDDVRLYDGSWAQWGSDPTTPKE